MNYVARHQHKAISEQSYEVLCNTDGLWIVHQNKVVSEQSSEFLCNTDGLGSYSA